ncbi:hypothetical protein CYMTET_6420, partial [Cymbomonas tetramitiformis]
MVTFSERLDKLGKVGTTWDPSALAPLKTDFMATTLDAPYRDPLPALLETPVLEQGVYLPEDGGEVMAVVKVEASDDAYWDELEALVQIKGALLMMKEEDVPVGVKLLDMSLILKRSDVEPCLYFIKDTEIMVIILALWMITSLPRMGGP